MNSLSDKQRSFLDALFGEAEGDLKKARDLSDYSYNTPVAQIVDNLKEEIENRTRSYIALNGPKAAFSLMSIIDKPGQLGNNLKLAAVKDVLDRAGFSKTEKIEVKSETPLFILPAKESNEDKENMESTGTSEE